MKKKLFVITIAAALVCAITFALCACDDKTPVDKLTVSGVDGYEATVDATAKTVTLSVENEVTGFALSKVKVPEGVTAKAFTDAECTTAIDGDLSFSEGLNTFYIRLTANVKDKDYSDVWTLKVTRAQKPAPESAVTEISIIKWKEDYEVGAALATDNKFRAVFEDDSERDIEVTADMLEGFDTTAAARKTVTLTYGGKTLELLLVVKIADNGEIPEYGDVTATTVDATPLIDAAARMAAELSISRYTSENADLKFAWLMDEFKNDPEYAGVCKLLKEAVKTAGFDATQVAKTAEIVDEMTGLLKECFESSDIWSMITAENLDKVKGWVNEIKALGTSEQFGAIFKEALGYILDMSDYVAYQYADVLAAAKAAGLNEVVAELERNENLYRLRSLKEYLTAFDDNEYAFATDIVLGIFSGALDVDSQRLCDLVLFVRDAVQSGSLPAILENFAYEEIVTNLNTAGDMILQLSAANERWITTQNLVKRIAKAAGASMGDMEPVNAILPLTEYLDVFGDLLSNLKTADLTEIYLKYDAFVKATESKKEVALGKLIICACNLAERTYSKLSTVEKDGFCAAVQNVLTLAFGFEIPVKDIMTDAVELADYYGETITDEYAKEATALYNEYMEIINSAVNKAEINGFSYTVVLKKDATVAEFIAANDNISYCYYDENHNRVSEPITLTAANIVGFDSSKKGLSSVTINYRDVSHTLKVYFYDETSINDFKIESCYVDYASFNKGVDLSQERPLEYRINIVDDNGFGFSRRGELQPSNAIGLNVNAPAWRKTAFLKVDFEIGSVYLPFRYYVYDRNDTTLSEIRVNALTRFIKGTQPSNYGNIERVFEGGNHADVIITADMISGLNLNAAGWQTFTVTYDGKTYEFKACVTEADLAYTFENLECHQMPLGNIELNDDYWQNFGGTSINVYLRCFGWDVNMLLSDASEALAETPYTIEFTPIDVSTVGEKTFTVTLKKNGVVIKSIRSNYTVVDSSAQVA